MKGDGQTIVAAMLKESLQQGNSPSLMVVSNSMSPLLRSGDKVVLHRIEPAQLELGQLITFAATDGRRQLVTHRVAGLLLKDGIRKIATFGDRSLLFDPLVDYEDVVGVVVGRRRNGRYLDLREGRGASLNRQLTLLARVNLKKVTGLAGEEIPHDDEAVGRCNETCRTRRAKLRMRIYLRLRYYWASILTFRVDT